MLTKDVKKMQISSGHSIRTAMRQMDEAASKNLYVVNEVHQLIGVLSDGDIRRSLLNGIGLDEKVETIMNHEPKFLYESEAELQKKVKKLMLSYGIESLAIVDEEKKITDIVYWVEVFKDSKKFKSPKKKNIVFMLAGGSGTRLEPFTRILPKPLIPVGDQPILEKIMDKFSLYGFEDFILSVCYKAEMIKLYFKDSEIRKKYSKIDFVQEEVPLGTIGSLHMAKDMIKESFFITNTDILIEEDLNKIFAYHKKSNSLMTVVGCIKNSKIPYGVINTDEEGFICDIKEKPEYNHIVNTGVYVAEPEIIEYIRPNERMDITELIDLLIKAGKKISVFPVLEEQWFDIGQWAEYEKTRRYFENK